MRQLYLIKCWFHKRAAEYTQFSSIKIVDTDFHSAHFLSPSGFPIRPSLRFIYYFKKYVPPAYYVLNTNKSQKHKFTVEFQC